MNTAERLRLRDLKREGHRLLDEYVSLEHKSWRKGKLAIKHAYDKLGTKLKRNYGKNHFSKMETEKEVIEAIIALKRMIKARKKKVAWLNSGMHISKKTLEPA